MSKAWWSPSSTEGLLCSLCSPGSPWPMPLHSLVGRSQHKLQASHGNREGKEEHSETPRSPQRLAPLAVQMVTTAVVPPVTVHQAWR